MVVMKKEQYVMCDIANCHACELLCVRLSHARLTVCVCVDYLLVCRPSPFGECDELRISSFSAMRRPRAYFYHHMLYIDHITFHRT